MLIHMLQVAAYNCVSRFLVALDGRFLLMSFSYDNKVLTGIQWGRRMHGDPRAFQTLSERVCGDYSVAGGNQRTCLLLLYMVPHGPHLYEAAVCEACAACASS
jgi:hypothetical protein